MTLAFLFYKNILKFKYKFKRVFCSKNYFNELKMYFTKKLIINQNKELHRILLNSEKIVISIPIQN